MQALILLQEELYVNNPGDASEENADRFSVLAIAFFNCGVEQEHMFVLVWCRLEKHWQ
jgi:hypothetical protein